MTLAEHSCSAHIRVVETLLSARRPGSCVAIVFNAGKYAAYDAPMRDVPFLGAPRNIHLSVRKEPSRWETEMVKLIIGVMITFAEKASRFVYPSEQKEDLE